MSSSANLGAIGTVSGREASAPQNSLETSVGKLSQETTVYARPLRNTAEIKHRSLVMPTPKPNAAQVELMTTEQDLLKRITARPDVFGGKPIIRDMRISVELILSLLAQGVPQETILDDYPDLEAEDIRACNAYARAVIARDTLAAVRHGADSEFTD